MSTERDTACNSGSSSNLRGRTDAKSTSCLSGLLQRCLAWGNWFGILLKKCVVFASWTVSTGSNYFSTVPDETLELATQRPLIPDRQIATAEDLAFESQQTDIIMHIPASRIGSRDLKEYLDRHHPGQYYVQLKRDIFTIKIKGQKIEAI
ncbi:hypothetical protein F4776DRAFT_659603 [Hypoxylon sp. NC0597]|nr:hypothetical protein F4776DRAFT_659603 [Hypoxylon sp. NC0597]